MRTFGRLTSLTVVLAVVLATAATMRSAQASVPQPAVPGTSVPKPVSAARPGIKLGVFTGTDPRATDRFGAWLGRDVEYAVDYSTRTTWNEIANPTWMLGTWRNSPYRMVYGVALLPTAKNDRSTIAAGARGSYDKYYRKLAQNLVAYGQGDAIIRLGWEFNHPDYVWHPTNPKQFTAYWRRVVKTMRSVPGARKLRFDWNVNNGNQSLRGYNPARYYPGPKYVDYIGVDIYDISWPHYPYPRKCGTTCRRQHQTAAWKLITQQQYGLNYWTRFARSKKKPLTLPEWGAWDRKDKHGGADNPYYISQMYAFIHNPKNHVAYQSYFEFDSPSGKHKLTTLKGAGKRYRKLFN